MADEWSELCLHAQAQYDYEPQNRLELELSAGDDVVIAATRDEDWYVGYVIDKHTDTPRWGFFPRAFVAVVDSDGAAVKVVAEGSRKKLDRFVRWCARGPTDLALEGGKPQFVGDVVNLGGSDAVLAAELQVREDEALARVLLQLRKDALEETVGDGVKSGEV